MGKFIMALLLSITMEGLTGTETITSSNKVAAAGLSKRKSGKMASSQELIQFASVYSHEIAHTAL